jgi:hypothetical protein
MGYSLVDDGYSVSLGGFGSGLWATLWWMMVTL